MSTFVKTIHDETYAAIDPTQPALSAAGKTILITGGATGIGFETARAFATAGAARVILLARSVDALNKAKDVLAKAFPRTTILTIPTDIADDTAVKSAFSTAREKGEVDIVVLSAAAVQNFLPVAAVPASVLDQAFAVNVKGNLNVVLALLSTGAKGKTVVNIGTAASYMTFPGISTYGASKLAWNHMMDHIQADNLQAGLTIFQVHPGTVLTDAAKKAGITTDTFPHFDDIKLPAHFVVWLVSPEASFLRGRFVWAAWDVDELVAKKDAILADPTVLTTTLKLV